VEVIRYEQSSTKECPASVVFLAGPTPRVDQPHLTSWRFEAIEEFTRQGFKGTLIIPEFTDTAPHDHTLTDGLPQWEMDGMDRSRIIMFWIPRTKELIGLTTNCEFGYWLAKDHTKVVYGRPDEAYRTRYTDFLWRRTCGHERIHTTLHDTVTAAILMCLWP